MAWVPEGTAEERLLALQWSPGLPVGAFDPRHEAARAFLAEYTAGLALIEDQIASPSDGWLRSHDGEFHCVGEVDYHVIREVGEREKTFSGSLTEGNGAMWLHGVLFCPTDGLLQSLVSGAFGARRPKDAWEEFETVWFQAYDADGYVEWQVRPKR
jgi:hypothetical protein